MNLKEKLLKRLPKKYHVRIESIIAENDLIDDCKYMLYLNKGWCFYGYDGGITFPVKSITEAVDIIKYAVSKEDNIGN